MKRSIKQIITVVLVLALVVGIFPVHASAAAQMPLIKLTDFANGITLSYGNSKAVKGTVTSSTVLTRVVGEIYSAAGGKAIYSAVVTPNATTLNLQSSAINSKLTFGKLAPGNYKLKITAEAKSSAKAVLERSFTVSAKPTINLTTFTTATYNKSHSVKGEVKSYTILVNVTGIVKDSTGTEWFKISCSPNTKTFDIQKSAINSGIRFKELPRGTYTLKISATNSAGLSDSKSFTFQVK